MARTFVRFGGVFINPWKVCHVEDWDGKSCTVGFGGDKEVELDESAEDVVAALDRVLARRQGHRGGREADGAARRRPRLDSDAGTREV